MVEPVSNVSIPNIITIGRILLVPAVVWAMSDQRMQLAFVLFVIAGVSDAIDGFLAKRFGMATELAPISTPWPTRRSWSAST